MRLRVLHNFRHLPTVSICIPILEKSQRRFVMAGSFSLLKHVPRPAIESSTEKIEELAKLLGLQVKNLTFNWRLSDPTANPQPAELSRLARILLRYVDRLMNRRGLRDYQ